MRSAKPRWTLPRPRRSLRLRRSPSGRFLCGWLAYGIHIRSQMFHWRLPKDLHRGVRLRDKGSGLSQGRVREAMTRKKLTWSQPSSSPAPHPGRISAGQKGFSRQLPQANDSIDSEFSIFASYREYLLTTLDHSGCGSPTLRSRSAKRASECIS